MSPFDFLKPKKNLANPAWFFCAALKRFLILEYFNQIQYSKGAALKVSNMADFFIDF
jgi:hypothetical protein